MRRRALVAGLTTAAAAGATAQSPGGIRRVALIVVNAEGDPEGQARAGAFRQRLRELGWEEGRNLRIDFRWDASDAVRARAHAAEVTRGAPDVVLAQGTPALAAMREATSAIPVVFVVVADPVGAGYVHSLARPGGNVTGFSTFEPEIGGKWIELLREMAPGLRRIAGILDPGFPGFAGLWREIEAMAPRFDVAVTRVVLREQGDDIESAVAAFAREPGGGLIVLPTAINNTERARIFALATRHRLPAIYPFRFFAVGGGLMSYGFDTVEQFRQGAAYIDRILRGESPGNLPVQAPTRYELIVNLRAAAAIDVGVPQRLLLRADEVIE